ncbi:MAG: MotA/TolQ/ExbB proton channel family protein [Pirellulaceae bacterium]|nr:MotA/TolQ/ExbB proton channel family protein [Pirellulaceae bacterium]
MSRPRASFELPLLSAVIIGSVLTLLFYGLLIYGPLDNALLKRYCLCHAVAEASVWLFFIAVVGMAIKMQHAFAQRRVTQVVGQTLDRLVVEGQEVPRNQRSLWLEAHWLSLPEAYRESWIGRRVAEIIERQIKRGKHSLLETDIRDMAEADGDAQHDSYAIVRIVSWAMPMLGFLGTVIGISDTLGQLDTELLASQSQAALKQMTSGLFVAFDTTAIALVLTIVAIFVQFTVSRFETNLLSRMDEVVRDNLVEFLGSDARQAEQDLLAPVRQMADDLVSAVHQLVEQQATLWSRSITESQKQWATWSSVSSDALRTALCESLDKSLTQHAQQIEKIQQEAGRQVDSRWQQWQITLSDQARVMHAQQKELVRQTESIDRLVTSTCDLKKVEEAVRESFGGFQHMERLREATLGISEIVAVLAGSLERSGIIRGMPVKPRSARKVDETDPDQQRKSA